MDHDTAREVLRQELATATLRAKVASERFEAASRMIPNRMADRLGDASREYTAAREKVTTAIARWNDLVERGAIPQDLLDSA
jgi:hypothetical protein